MIIDLLTAPNKYAEKYYQDVEIEDNKAIKDSTKQALWKESKIAKMLETASSKAVTGRVASIGLAFYTASGWDYRLITFREEKTILKELNEYLNFHTIEGITSLHSKRMKEFTIPFLCRRYLANNIYNGLRDVDLMQDLSQFLMAGKAYPSSQCQENTSLEDDLFLIDQGSIVKTPLITEKPSDLIESYINLGDKASEEAINSYMKYRIEGLAKYVERSYK